MTWGGVIKNEEKRSFSKNYFIILTILVIGVAICFGGYNTSIKESNISVNKQMGSEVNSCNESGTKNVYYYNVYGYGFVKFANVCWQIIRTTDTGGVKLLYYGTYSSDGCSVKYQGIKASKFNRYYANAKEVGYKYKTTNINDTDSIIKTEIDSWYESNLQSYESYLEDIVFCNDRTGSTDNNSAATGTTWNGEGTGSFLYHNYSSAYTKLFCTDSRDRFSTHNTSAQLSHPIGLMSFPEVLLRHRVNVSGYNLGNSGSFWFLSPSYYVSEARMRLFTEGGGISDKVTYEEAGIRPVVSLAPGTTYVSGNGTISNPYVVQ